MKIIYIITFPPAYHYYNSEEELLNDCDHYWRTSLNKIVAVWKRDWAHVIAKNLIELNKEIKVEVWRPDFNADKLYTVTFEYGVIHRTFPAVSKKMWRGLHYQNSLDSPLLIEYLSHLIYQKEKILVICGFVNKPLVTKIIKLSNENFPLIGSYFLNCEQLFPVIYFRWNFLYLIHEIIIKFQIHLLLKSIHYLIVVHKNKIKLLKQKYSIFPIFWTIGIDLNNFVVTKSIIEIRKKLNLPTDAFIVLSSSRLVPEKQVDKIIIAFSKLQYSNALLIITGNGPVDYILKLKDLVISLNLNLNVIFTGYVDDSVLKEYFQACDVFFMGSKREAGPLSTFMAMAYSKPIISTPTGLGFELLSAYKAGIIVPLNNVDAWTKAIDSVASGHLPSCISLDDLKNEIDTNRMFKNLKEAIQQIYFNFYKIKL